MNTSELVQSAHISKSAIIYIRQSSPHQVITNQESLRMQYALKQKAAELGWQEESIEIIDRDLGITAASAEKREGFKDLVTKVTLGQVGIVLSYEVTRLARNCSDWYPLLDICGIRGCLIGDRDGVYDPSTSNGRLLLGLKGQISELELHTLKGRLTAGIVNKAQRGELALTLPVGLVRNKQGIVTKDANIEVQKRIELIFETFQKARSASKTLRYFNDNDLTIPRRDHFGDIAWRKPSIGAIIRTLKNPAYAGMFVYGRTCTIPAGQSSRNNSRKTLSIDKWRIKVENKYPKYIEPKIYDKIQAMLQDNHAEYDRSKSRGIPRPGKAMLHGIVYCGECGHKMIVQYKPKTRYTCNHLRQQYGTRVCQNILADPIDDFVVAAFFEALSPVEVDIYQAAMFAKQKDDEQLDKAKQQQLERLRYQARLAERQFNQADPENRLVTAELEKRWESALLELRQSEEKMKCDRNHCIPHIITQEMKESFDNIGRKMPEIWRQAFLSQQQRKSLLRCLIEKVIVHRVGRDKILTRVVWRGGDTTTTEISVTVGSMADLSNAKEMEDAIVKMAKEGRSDLEISGTLTKRGFRSPLRRTVLESTVQTIRLRHRIIANKKQSHPRNIPGCLTVSQIASRIGVANCWIYDRINNGRIAIKKDAASGLYLFPNSVTTINQFKAFKAGELENIHY